MKLYIYDHCPYCVRVMLTIGLKKIPCSLEYFLNDDEEGPMSKVSSKQVPILEKSEGDYMPESLDIVAYLERTYQPAVFSASSHRENLSSWISDTSNLFRQLLMPRWVQLDLPEFATQSARDYFTKKKTAMIGDFGENLSQSSQLINNLERYLLDLEKLFKNPLILNDSLSYDDLDLWSRLRGLTCVKGLKIPKQIKEYIDHYAGLSGVTLFYDKQI